ncbi:MULTISPECIES: protoporphyrinogen oxidase [unclassified Paenibacillus]|uniref:protoporphyrinogen oxidase n=1 Tax=unclassified Paenibacillus TaxID=185978 RepID=UPI001AE84368|nr:MULTISPECIES: protoporphyrinogen oxidase [unclassified Paenibacillus]MBP1156604.1 oxygen-dependent protoporphyrinogen oxidase [Paenibacillus sp. PvP091]MBP1172658.1 oxygen-dependent protoporphyrinogen oxidase [Paenibacillus sp. PvR098]MBP2439038.1 oxygen-dependent protoporphyrinogen oxidase [Paenibacillus sp. PvP052]
MDGSAKHVVIIGGGITGLSAAYDLKKSSNTPLRITLMEKGETFGGKIHTLKRDGFIIEKGPDSFLARKQPIIDLTRELGLEDQLTGTNPNAKKTYILSGGKLHRMPPGLMLGIPTQMVPFMRTGLLSMSGKARAALDLVLPKRTSPEDESLGHFLERRLGTEVLAQIAEPLLAGIYAGDTYNLSLRATFPQFHAIEQKHRSLILGMMQNRKAGGEESRTLPEAARNTTFLTYKEGLETLVHGLLDALDDVRFLKQCGVSRVEKTEQGYRVIREDGAAEEADGVIVALPAYGISEVLGTEVPEVRELDRIDYVSVANVILAFDSKDMVRELDGSGFVVPRREGRFITACTWTSVKWLHAAPTGKVLLRCYVGRSGDDRWLHMTEDGVLRAVRKDLKDTMGITAEPIFTEMTKLMRSMPQYPVGHLELIRRVREALSERMPGVLVTGGAFQGVGLPDCIRQGREAAQQMAAHLK